MYFKFLKKKRRYNEYSYELDVINLILSWRKQKYISPMVWYRIPDTYFKIPNSPREYRKEYTDWIHHWWDMDSPFWEEVIALDDWIIVRIVRGFDYSDLWKIKRWNNLTYEEKLKNLDLLRWNQVWLKTVKWDVVFYSHLDKFFSYINEWMIIKSWIPLWTVWISWIPDKSYNNSHLHFAIMKNPYNKYLAWSYDILDYMKWDWLFMNKDMEYIIENTKNIFVYNNLENEIDSKE